MNKLHRLAIAAGIGSAITVWTGAQYKLGKFKSTKKDLTKVGLSVLPQIAALASTRKASSPAEKQLMMTGFCLSAAGDIGLGCGDERGQIPGFLAFLAAQTVNTVAYAKRAPFATHKVPFVIYALAASGYAWYMWPKINDRAMRPAVVVYAASIAGMAAQVASAAMDAPAELRKYWMRSAVGGALQFTSDAILGYNLFVKKLPAGDALVMYPYWAAQMLYGASLRPAS